MKQSQLLNATLKEAPQDEVSVNAKLLTRGGFVAKLTAGVYTYLPLGLRVLQKISGLVREEMQTLGAQELLLPALHPKEVWQRTDRWSNPGREVMFQLQGRGEREYGLGWTHEEVITPLLKPFLRSYRELPLALYQIQTKFRDEPRAKSGLLRGREFIMKDLYSFHATTEDLDQYYEQVKSSYNRIFKRLELSALCAEASGGAFSPLSHEFQVPTPAGEDIILQCPQKDYVVNREIAKVQQGENCPYCGTPIEARRAIEVGNIFRLGTRFAQSFNLTYKDQAGAEQLAVMGCYGLGITRLLGALVEVHHDERGIIWPAAAAPFTVHLLALQDLPAVRKSAEQLYQDLQKIGVAVLYDERTDVSAGEKFAEADLLGCPLRLIVSEKTLAQAGVETKLRAQEQTKLMTFTEVVHYASSLA